MRMVLRHASDHCEGLFFSCPSCSSRVKRRKCLIFFGTFVFGFPLGDDASDRLEGHPHLTMPGSSIEVLEIIPIGDI